MGSTAGEDGSDAAKQGFHASSLLIILFPLACIALGLIRISPTDTPWHLASARAAFETAGFWPQWLTCNTFSYTFPEFSLNQQYPVYQSLLYGMYQAFGFEGLSILHCILWLSTFLLLGRLSGGLQTMASYPLVWAMILLGLQRRMILRPDILTLPLLLLHLLNWELFDRGRIGKTRFFFTALLLQWLLVNSHQMWTLGIAAMLAFLFDSLLSRNKEASATTSQTIKKKQEHHSLFLFATLLACLMVTCLNPLGWEILLVPLTTIGSLSHHSGDVTEFAAFGTNLYPSTLVIAALLVYAGSLWVTKVRPRVYEIVLVAGGFVLALLALRGTVFAVGLAGLFTIRNLKRYAECKTQESLPESSCPQRPCPRKPGLFELSIAFSIPLLLIFYSHCGQIARLQGNQYGIGKSLGQWPNTSLQFLKENPPKGRLLNLSWYLGNSIIWELYPRQKVFVDPRFESYPREFLKKAIRAERDFDTLTELIDEYQPEVILLELRLGNLYEHARRLLESGAWQAVALDPQILVLAKSMSTPDSYAAQHGTRMEHMEITGLTSEDPRIRQLEVKRLRGFYSRISVKMPAIQSNGSD